MHKKNIHPQATTPRDGYSPNGRMALIQNPLPVLDFIRVILPVNRKELKMAGHKYLPNGKIQIVITHGTDLKGKPKRYWKTIDHCSKKQLEIEDALFLAEILNKSRVSNSDATVSALFNDFLENHCRDLKVSTVGRYKTLYQYQIAPYFGSRKIQSIAKVDIRDWVEELLNTQHPQFKDRTLAPKTVKNALGLLRTLFNYAIDELELLEKNPCRNVKVKQKNILCNTATVTKVPETHSRAPKNKPYSESECIDLIRCLMSEREKGYAALRHSTLLLMILFTGLRTSEVMGLRWNDIVFSKRLLSVERERIYVPHEGTFLDSVKTSTSERIISIPEFLIDLLRELQQAQERNRQILGKSYTPSGFIAVLEDGRPQSPRLTYNWFKSLQKKHGFRSCSIHDLRHTHAAMLSSLGVKIIDVSKRLGHSNTRVTQEVYEYLFSNADQNISDELDEYIKEKSIL